MTDPILRTIGVRIDAITDQMNALRNAVLGRGARPPVPSELAERIATAYEQWRTTRERLIEGALSPVPRFDPAAVDAWEIRANELRAAAIGAGFDFDRPALPEGEIVNLTPIVFSQPVIGLAAITVGLAVLYVWTLAKQTGNR